MALHKDFSDYYIKAILMWIVGFRLVRRRAFYLGYEHVFGHDESGRYFGNDTMTIIEVQV